MNYHESLEYLLSLGNEVLAMKLGLESIGKLFNRLGNPHKNFLKVQVAGTNGKGSTCAFLDAICRSAGINTGLYTSPHLISITERIRINGEDIGQPDFARHATLIREVSEDLVKRGELETVPTFFEQITAIAVSAFGEAGIELGILETGLGGRFDATTATNAEIVGITPIDYDHQQILGNTLTEIAGEKAAIIRPDTRVVIAKQKEEAKKVILERCLEAGVEPIYNSCGPEFESSDEISFKTKNNTYPAVRLSLKGRHQIENACVAINLTEILIREFKFEILQRNIIEGLETAVHKGRLELQNGFLFDGAHNIAGAKALREYLREFRTDSRIIFVFGAMRDKDLAEIAEILFPLAETLILTQPDNSRSAGAKDLRMIAERFLDKNSIFVIPDVAEAIDTARQITANYPAIKDSIICITGSLYLVGEAQSILEGFSK